MYLQFEQTAMVFILAQMVTNPHLTHFSIRFHLYIHDQDLEQIFSTLPLVCYTHFLNGACIMMCALATFCTVINAHLHYPGMCVRATTWIGDGAHLH